jgi:hypothetical protein
MQILLQDKYNIGALTVNIEFMWLGTKQMERLAKASLSPLFKSRHINSIFTIIHQYCIFIVKIKHCWHFWKWVKLGSQKSI